PLPVGFLWCVGGSLVIGASSPGILALGQSLARPEMRAFSAALWSMVFTLVGMSLGPSLVGDLSTRLTERLGNQSIRWALATACAWPLVGAMLYLRGTRTLRADLARARAS